MALAKTFLHREARKKKNADGNSFAAGASASYTAHMSTAVLELKDKVERLTSGERFELMQILEDIEDNAMADKAESCGDFIAFEEYKKLTSEDQLS